MKRPVLLVGCTEPDDDGGYQDALFASLSSQGFVVEPIPQRQAPACIERVCLAPTSRPDALLFAPEMELGTPRFGYPDSKNAYELIDEIRSLPDHLCFPGQVRAKTLPIILAAFGTDPLFYSPERHPWGKKWCRVVRDPRRLHDEIREGIREWRQALLSELDYVGYAITRDEAGQFHVSHAALRRQREGDILAEDASLHGLRSAGYYILKSDVIDDLPAYRELEALLSTFRDVADARECNPETALQDFFERNPHMMLGDSFGGLRPKARIPRPNGCHPWVPDFAQEPRPFSLVHNRWGFTDLKLPDVRMLNAKRLHRGFSAKVKEALDQLLDYRDDIENADSRAQALLMKWYGCIPRNPKLAVIIGRRPSQVDEIEELDHRIGTYAPLGVEVMPYDDILDGEEDRLLLQFSLGAGF